MSGIPAGAGSLVGKRLGKYDILALLALGGTAEIYLARIGGTAGFEKYVVVKCLHDHLADDTDFVKMFLDEARLAAMLDHSNIVQTFELGEYENRYYMVMEFLAGLSLAMIVRKVSERVQGGKVPVPLVLNVAAQACAGLHYAHERSSNGKPLNMVHRDISPQNLVISFEGIVKVVDFGIARAEMRETKTKAGTIKGKFAYMSPEQCVATNVDRRTDVFALGVIVWELLTSRRLFKRTSPYETYQAVLECNVPKPSSLNHEIDSGLEELVMRAITKDKEERFPTAEAFGDAMLSYLHSRAKGSGPAELSKFFDQHFAQEIDEHGERMRELIAGREFNVDGSGSWGAGDDRRSHETVDLGARLSSGSMELESMDMVEMRRSSASLDDMVAQLGPGREDEEGDVPAEKTRIEMNPLEQVKELDEVHARRAPSQPAAAEAPTRKSASGAEPLPAPPIVPNLAHLPTLVSDHGRAPLELARDDVAGLPMRPSPSAVVPLQPMAPPSTPSSPQLPVEPYPRSSTPYIAMTPPGASPYPVMHGGRPFSTDLAPSKPPTSQRSPYSRDSDLAAHMASPVGDRYPHPTDWAAAAARPAKALPTWMLAALFVGAMGIALVITIVIAKIVR